MLHPDIQKNVRFNFVVNVLDGSFFGLGLGFASFVTILPLFVATLTDNTVLIGMIASIHTIGWQLPQLFTAGYVARLRRYKPMVMFMTFHERWPFFGLSLVALLVPTLGRDLALALAFGLILWHSIGGGLTATAWQSMIGKIMPARRRGTFWGAQGAAANLMFAGGAVVAGLVIDNVAAPYNFGLCFLITGLFMMVSMAFLAQTREPESEVAGTGSSHMFPWRSLVAILRNDRNFRWFVLARLLSQFAWMAVAFYTIYAVRRFNMSAEVAGVMAGVLALAQTVGNPVLGWIGDRWGHRQVFAFGALIAVGSALVALFAPELNWFYVAFGLAGCASAVLWTIAMSMTLEFGAEAERPLYIGLTNTLIAPATIAAPLIGGWLADQVGFEATFVVAALCGLLTAVVLQFGVRDPRKTHLQTVSPADAEAASLDLAA